MAAPAARTSFHRPASARLTPRERIDAECAGTYADLGRVIPSRREWQYRLLKRAGNRAALRALLRKAGVLETDSLLRRVRAPTLLMWGAERTPGREPRIGTAGCESFVAVAGCDESVQ